MLKKVKNFRQKITKQLQRKKYVYLIFTGCNLNEGIAEDDNNNSSQNSADHRQY